MDLGDIVALLGSQFRLQSEIREADDSIHRRADLMAHISEEAAFRLVRLLGGGLGLLQLSDHFLQFCVQGLQLHLRFDEFFVVLNGTFVGRK